mmetsp:Transcript_65956/g.162334  ORF Transcript_65956/g.162334 Transcript_65956/m.162334 type:complete len:268 (+) Transcript_65956:93-896(+)
MSIGGDFLKTRLRAQETSYTRELDKHAIKSIRDALKGTNELEAARERLEAQLAKECDGDVLAEVSAARTMNKFREEDLPPTAVTIRPVMYQPSKQMTEHEEFLKHVEVPSSGMQVAAGSYNDLMRGRYKYLNNFMETMQVDDEERRPMTKRELKRLEKMAHHGRYNVMYISGSFLIGTALCGGAAYLTWIWTKSRLGVKDSKEYVEKMRELTPSVKKDMDESVLGKSMKRFKSGVQSWITGSTSLSNFSQVMKNNMGGIQKKPEESA